MRLMMKRKTLPLLFSALLLTAPVSQAASTLFELNPTISTVSFDYQAEVSTTVSFESILGPTSTIRSTTVINQQFSESASGSLTAHYEADRLFYKSGTIEANYNGSEFGSPTVFTISGIDIAVDLLISPNSFRFDLPAFDAGNPVSSSSNSSQFAATPVSITMLKDFESSATVSLVDPETPPAALIDTQLTDTTSASSILMLASGSSADSLTLLFEPFQSEAFNSVQIADVIVGTFSVSISTTETISNLEVTLAPVPLPAAVWLLLTALAGLMGLRRQV